MKVQKKRFAIGLLPCLLFIYFIYIVNAIFVVVVVVYVLSYSHGSFPSAGRPELIASRHNLLLVQRLGIKPYARVHSRSPYK